MHAGFDSYYGYWSGAEDYYTHDTHGAYDFADGTDTCRAANNSYSTHLFAARAVQVIETQAAAGPFFLYLAWQNVHWPLEAPQAYVDRFAKTTGGNTERQHVAAMAAILDDGVRRRCKHQIDAAAAQTNHHSLWHHLLHASYSQRRLL